MRGFMQYRSVNEVIPVRYKNIALAVGILIWGLLASCGKQAAVLYTVRFDLNYDGSVAFLRYVSSGTQAVEPGSSFPRQGYRLTGWSVSENGDTFDFSTPIVKDITLYAQWETHTGFTVSFDANGGTSPPAEQTVIANDKAKVPNKPLLSNYKFTYWSLTKESYEPSADNPNTPFDFNTAITGSITLYAQWEAGEICAVTFDTSGGTKGTGTDYYQTIPKGNTVSAPANDPTYWGHSFQSWSVSENGGTLFDFGTAITESIILYAQWDESESFTVSFDFNGAEEPLKIRRFTKI